jgi:hypothetical protein
MSSANFPFSIFPKKDDPDSFRRKDRYVLIDIPLDPNDPSSQKITHKYNKPFSTEVEDILEFFSTFDNIVKTLALSQGAQRFRLIPAMMGHDAQKNGSIFLALTVPISPNKSLKTVSSNSYSYLGRRTFRSTQTKTSHQRKSEHSAHKIKPNKPYYQIHGKCNHSSSQCDKIRKQREEYKSTTNNKNKKNKKPWPPKV